MPAALCTVATGEITRAKPIPARVRQHGGGDPPIPESVRYRGAGRLYRDRLPGDRRLGGDDQPQLGVLDQRNEGQHGAEPSGSDQRFHRRLDGDPDALVGRRAAVWRRRCAAGQTDCGVWRRYRAGRCSPVHVDRRWVSLPGEGGHVDFAPNSEEEDIILEVLRAEVGHVSAERVLSGPGHGQSVSRHRQRRTTACRRNGSRRTSPSGRWQTAASTAAARSSLFCVIMGRFGGNRRAESGHLRRRVHRRRHRAALYGILQGLGLPRRFRRQGGASATMCAKSRCS